MIRIDVMTATRAEYGLMRPLLQKMQDDEDIDLHLIVTGTHLSERYGNTFQEIENDGVKIYKKIPILSQKDGATGITETMSNAMLRFSEYFAEEKPDFLLVDGDRYEALAICLAAINYKIPVIHCSGGATTEGAADEIFRHCLTKISYLHFPTTEIYRKRILQMGEQPDRVFTVGSMGIENIVTQELMSKKELEQSIGFKLDMPYAVVTFHPVTLEKDSALEQINALIEACKETVDMKFIFTMANADDGGEIINKRIKEFADTSDRVLTVKSLGAYRYLSALKHCEFVIGNSSSGLIEAPSFKIPTVNIGDRQKGRLKAGSVIDCLENKESIIEAIHKARSEDFRNECSKVINPNGDGNTSSKIIYHIKNYVKHHCVDLKKKFYDIDYDYQSIK